MARGEFQEGGALRRANPRTIQDKVLVGYQGWFTCAGDGEPTRPGHHGWLHWFHNTIPSGGRPNTDLWPDTSEYDPSELYLAPGLATASGDPVYLFSSRHPKTVRRHFHWMALHGVDGAFLQRFAGQCEIKSGNLGVRNLRDEVGERVREAAEAEGRVFAIMYDVSGVAPDKIQNILEQDWVHLLHDQHLLDSPNYLREQDRPVVVLWGFGLNGRNHTPQLVRGITEFFRSSTPGGVYLVAGTPGHWRTSTSDADRNPGFVQMWTECFDAISPWTVGRYGNEEAADRWGKERVKADFDYLKKLEEEGGRKVDYMPVVLPGGSGFNLSEGKWGMNDIRRNGGQFLWRQIYNARLAGVRMIYGAMWDEYDEGTAFMPVVPHSSQLPVHPSFRFIALDVDGHDLPSDWYMRILGIAAEVFHGERTLLDTLPYKELQDYWSTRPRRDDDEEHKKHVNVDEVTRAFREWEVSGGSVNDAPPPYSLEDRGPRGQQRPQALTCGVGRTGRPPVPQDTRPSPSHHSSLSTAVRTAAAPLAAAVAHTLSAGSASAGPRCTPSGPPPPVDMSSRPSLSKKPHQPSKEFGIPPPLPQRPASPPLPPPHAAYDLGRQQTPDSSAGVHYAAYQAHRMPSPNPSMAFPSAVGYPVEYERGRSRSRSRSRSRERKQKHKKYSRSHSSSGSRKKGRSPVPGYAHDGYGHGHGHGHAHSLSPVGPSHALAVPSGGLYHAHSESDAHGVRHGSYTPVHSYPVEDGGFTLPMGSAYGHGQPQNQVGYPQPQHPSSSSYYASYVPGTGTTVSTPYSNGPVVVNVGRTGSGIGRGGLPGGIIASALQTVEGIATRQVEKTVKTLTNTGNTLMNKLK